MPIEHDDYEAGSKRPSYAARARRTHLVLTLIGEGKHRHEIQAICSPIFDLGKPGVDRYILKAKKEAIKMATSGDSELLAACVIDLQALYIASVKAEKYQTALNVRKEMNRVLHIGEKREPVTVDTQRITAGEAKQVTDGLPDFLKEA